ncbi:hypothetical protein L3X38_027574 [Prunus dulcis]|uniref:Uncharacterized protein n=1 Tax=Prunus dulcis TaxID=3755 RepID=A0AAD4YZL3_PRUDU|nr:hypothetical protein L3X38_027574 [Prunus dulcis]
MKKESYEGSKFGSTHLARLVELSQLLAGGAKQKISPHEESSIHHVTRERAVQLGDQLSASTYRRQPQHPYVYDQSYTRRLPNQGSTATSRQGCLGFRQFQVSQVFVSKFQIREGT